MEAEILEILTNAKNHKAIFIYSVSGIFQRLKNKSGGRKACARAANRLVKKKLIRKVYWYDSTVSFSAI